MRGLSFFVRFSAALFFASACTEDTTGPPPPPPDVLPVFEYTAAFEDLPERAWAEIGFPDGGCAHGGEFAFFVYRADPTRLLVDFAGGGACWNAETCDVSAGTFESSLEDERQAFSSIRPPGILNHTNAQNFFAEYTHIVVTQCTGDVYLGNRQTMYGSLPINHFGAINARGVVDWMSANALPVSELVVGGCSAGSYGAAFWAGAIYDVYPDARKTLVTDSGHAVIADGFAEMVLPLWADEMPFPDWVMPDRSEVSSLWLSVHAATAMRYPDAVHAEFTSLNDGTQLYFFVLSGGDSAEFGNNMMQTLRDVRAASPNSRVFLSDFPVHCVLPGSGYYALRSNDTFFRDWLSGMVDRSRQEDVICEACEPL